MEFSVIMVCFNPNLKKAIKTLSSIVRQKDCNFELIICDDGSKNSCLDEMQEWLKAIKFHDYVIVRNKHNQGTVKNIESGLYKASGRYVVLISPGDYLYSDLTLYHTEQFIAANHSDIVFGDYVAYSEVDGQYQFYDSNFDPVHKECFDKSIDYNADIVIENIWGKNDRICGATICYEVSLLKKYLSILEAEQICYVEDLIINITCLDGVRIWRMPYYVRWYECNTGISFGYNSFSEKINQDWECFAHYIIENYSNPVAIASANAILKRHVVKSKWNHGIFKYVFYMWNVLTNRKSLKKLEKEKYDFEIDNLMKL